jgi:hypothetical protein
MPLAILPDYLSTREYLPVGYYFPLPSDLLTQGSCLSGFQQSL